MFNFKELITAWRSEGLVSEMFKDFEGMLAVSAEMFDTVKSVLSGDVAPDDAWEGLRAQDKKINRTERSIRRRIVEHLSVGGADVPTCLILMSIVKDAERIGDYMGYLFKAARICPGAAKTEGFAEVVAELEADVASLMADGRKAIAESDEALAREVMERENPLKEKCDRMLEECARAALPPERIVAMTLLSRYFRRLAGHTANIASGIINPVERLDYKPKD
jgi:phosphate uptake regulator